MRSLPLLLLGLVASFLAHATAEPSQPIRVLVAAPSGPAGFANEFTATLNQRGAKAQAGPLDAIHLAQADVLILAEPELTPLPPADRPLLEAFAHRGGGIIAVGGAIAAGEPAWWKPLVGGAWTPESRKFFNKMMLFTLTDAHPITRDASPFDVDDDTLYDLDTDPAINVLASAFTPKVTSKRIDPRSPERQDRANVYDLQPQMWSFEGADGHRAFALLPSKPETLRHSSLQTFLLRAVAWAAKRDNVDALCHADELAAVRYPQNGARPAQETIKSFDLQPGFKASVVAHEPLITKPIAMQWDARGRLWIAETPEYPNGRRPLVAPPWKETGVLVPDKYDRPAQDRISILSEPDAKGLFTKKTVFHQGLELVTGFCLYGDGVIAVGQPDIVFIHGEGAGQKVERLYTGFTPGDTHFVANHFIVAPDGWIYADTGSGPKVESVSHPEVRAQLSSGLFRFKPDGSAIEQVSSKGGNSFGAEVTSDGELFFGQATSGNPVQHVVLPEWLLNKGASLKIKSGAESVINGRKVIRPDMPDRAPFMQIDVVGGYSSACACTVDEAGAWPAEWDHCVFCTEPILDIIHCEKLVPKGPAFTGEVVPTDAEWLRAHDFWFFPVDVEFGPDGAMYVLDFYCPVVAHSDTRGPQHSKAGASVRPDRDHYFGRIYRIQYEGAKKLDIPDLTQADPVTLVKAFTHPNKEIRFTAHRLLLARPDAASAVPALQAMADAERFAPARILALWALERLNRLTPGTLQAALGSDDAGVRKSALLIVEALGPKSAADLAPLLNDPDQRVRLDALRAMASSPLTPASAAALLAVLPKLEDDYSRSAATVAASSNAGPVLEAALIESGAPSGSLLDLAGSLARALAEKHDAAALARVFIACAKAAPAAAPLVRTVLEAAGSQIPPPPAAATDVRAALKQLLRSSDPAISAGALPFATAWGNDGASEGVTGQRIETLLALARDEKQPDALRASAILGLVRSRQADPRIIPAVLALLKTKLSDPLLGDVIAALAATADPKLGQPLTALLPNLSPIGQNALFDALSTRVEWASAVLDAIQAKELKPSLLGPARLSKLRLHPDPATSKRAIKVIDASGGGTNPAKDEIIAKLLPVIESKPGDPAKGKIAFTATCSVCHKLNGEGKEVGPVLDGIGVHGTNELLIHIIDPSRVVDQEHRTWSIALKNGSFAVGIIARQNDRSLTLHLPGGLSQDIQLADIKSRQDTGLSLMPEGLEALGPDTLRDILAYLRGGNSKFRALNLDRAFTTDTGGGLYHSRDAKNDSIPPVKYGVVTAEGVPFSLPDPTTTPTGGNVIVLQNNEGDKDFAASLPQKVEIPVGFAAGNLHFLSGVAGWGGGPDSHKAAMKVTIDYADGQKQIEELYTGDTFIDYVSRFDVPGSKRVDGIVQRHHIRYFSIPVERRAPIVKLILESYKNGVSPTVLAITASTDAPASRPKFASVPPPAPKPAEPLPKSGETLPTTPQPGTLRVLLLGGGSSHDFEKWFHQDDSAVLKSAGQLIPAYTSNLDEALALIPSADVIVLSSNQPAFGTPPFQQALQAFVAVPGHGLVILHPGVWYNWAPVSGYNAKLVGGGSRSHDALGPFTVTVNQPNHPIMKDVPASFEVTDELYQVVLDPAANCEVLATTSTSAHTHQQHPSVWTVPNPAARIACIALGHDGRAHDLPAFKTLLVNAIRWTASR